MTGALPPLPRSTRGRDPDHRRIVIWQRAQRRTERRALLLLARIDQDPPNGDPELRRLDRLIGQADDLAERLTFAPDIASRRRWRTAA